MDPSGFSSARDTIPQTPYSPADEDNLIIDLRRVDLFVCNFSFNRSL
jgi:hypothetical protein